MLTTENCERVLVESILADSDLAASVDHLLSHLLSELSGYQGRPTDGVSFEYSRVTGGQAAASGVVVMIENQTVEPLRVEFTLDLSSLNVSTGSVCFGDKTRNVAYGSREDRKLRHAIIANPDVEFSWKECFYRGGDGWRRGAA
jgi:hypothetical protein